MAIVDTAIQGAKGLAFSGASKLSQKVKTLVVGQTPEEKQAQKQTRNELSKISNQLDLTRTIITENNTVITELAQSDSRLSTLLSDIQDPQALAIQQKIVKGQEVNTQEAALVIANLEKVTKALEGVGVSLNVNLDSIVGKFSNLILDSEQDLDSRRAMLAEVVELSTKQNVNSEALPELKKLMESQLNFTAKETTQVTALLSQLKNDSTGKKMLGTLREIEEQNETLILSQEELNNLLEAKTATGKSVGDTFRTEGLSKTLTTGVLQSLLGSLGLGSLIPILAAMDLNPLDLLKGGGKALKGLGGILLKIPGVDKLAKKLTSVGGGLFNTVKSIGTEKVGGVAKSVATKATTVAKGVGGAVVDGAGKIADVGGKAAKGAGKLLSGGAKLLGKLAFPLAIIMGIMDFMEGFSNAAEVAGLEPGTDMNFGSKVIAGIASLISGLTFGLVDAKDLFVTLDKGVQFLIGDDGILSKIGTFFKDLFAKGWAMLSNIGTFYKDFYTKIGTFVSEGVSKIGSFIGDLVGNVASFLGGAFKKLFSKGISTDSLKEFGGTIIEKIANGVGTAVDFLFGPTGLISFDTLKKVAMFALSALPGGALILKLLGGSDTEVEKSGSKGSVGDRAISSVKELFGFGKETKGEAQPSSQTSTGTQVQPQATLASAESRKAQTDREKAATRPTNQPPTVLPTPNKGSAATVKRVNVDDYGVSLMNSVMLD